MFGETKTNSRKGKQEKKIHAKRKAKKYILALKFRKRIPCSKSRTAEKYRAN
jgi:hypothetical protein